MSPRDGSPATARRDVSAAGNDAPGRPARDVGGLTAAGVVVVLAGLLAVTSSLWPATRPAPGDNRQPVPEQSHSVADLPFTAVANGLGPVERNRANGGGGVDDGAPISIAGQVFDRGLGVFAPSRVRLHLNGACARFTAWAGLDDSVAGQSGVAGQGGVVFQVVADGVVRYESGRIIRSDSVPAVGVDVDVHDVGVLDLVVSDAGDGTAGDAASWAAAMLVCRDAVRGEPLLGLAPHRRADQIGLP